MKRCFRAKVDPHTERVFDVHLQSDNAKQRCSTRQINQQIQVASFLVEPFGNRTEDTHATRSLRCRKGQNMVALRSECQRGTHHAILAASEAPAGISR